MWKGKCEKVVAGRQCHKYNRISFISPRLHTCEAEIREIYSSLYFSHMATVDNCYTWDNII